MMICFANDPPANLFLSWNQYQ